MHRAREVKFFDAHAMIHAYQKVEFPTLEHFIEDIADMAIQSVRLDVFEEAKPSELTFVYYVTWTMYLTAQDSSGYVVYEYREPLGSTASSEKIHRDHYLSQSAQQRLKEVENELSRANLRVRRGRHALPDDNLM